MSDENTKVQSANPAQAPSSSPEATPHVDAKSSNTTSPSGEFELQEKDTDIIFSDNQDATASGADPLLGKVIDQKYKILAKLGTGGMGAVYRGEHTLMGRIVAIKVLHPQFVSNSDLLRRFQHEAQVASRLHHPNAIETYDYGVYRGAPYLVMQFVEGRTLKALIQEKGPLPLTIVQRIIREVGGALAQAHHLGIVHRDLKPENIMLVKQRDGTESAMLLDFGIAKVLSPDAANPNQTMTRAGTFCGTPKYASPEQVMEKPVDHRADIYTLGVILYEIISGETPFDAPSFLEILVKHVNEKPVPLREFKPSLGISVALDELVLRCLKKDPQERFQSVEELIEELSRVSGTPTPVTNVRPENIADPALPNSGLLSNGGSGVSEGASLGMLAAIIGGGVAVLGAIGYLLFTSLSSHEASTEIAQVIESQNAVALKAAEEAKRIADAELEKANKKIGEQADAIDLMQASQVAINKATNPANVDPAPQGGEDSNSNLAPSTDSTPNGETKPTESAFPQVLVTSVPEGAELYINGELKGTTPLTVSDLPIGSYPMVLKKSAFADLKTHLLVDPTATRPLSYALSTVSENTIETAPTPEVNNSTPPSTLPISTLQTPAATPEPQGTATPTLSPEQAKKEAMKLFREGNALYKSKSYAAAAEKFERAVALRSDAVGSMIALGNCYTRLGRKTEALTRYLAAVQTDSSYGPAHYNLAAFYAVTGRNSEAITALEKAIALDSRARISAASEPDFKSLQSDPRFQKLIKR